MSCFKLPPDMGKKFKRLMDISFSFLGLISLSWLIIFAWILSTINTRKNGIFSQSRVGRRGRVFKIYKIRTMKDSKRYFTSITHKNDPRITSFGSILRKLKIDELPQLWNVMIGDMSFVGPRPDVPGYADKLNDTDKSIILSVRPGITGPATLKYRNEEKILSMKNDPIKYNNEVIYPDKVIINKNYIENWSLMKDLKFLLKTIFN